MRERSPLYSTLFQARWDSCPEVTSCIAMLLRLLETSAGPQAVAGALREKVWDDGRTIVHSAAELGRVDCLKALTEDPKGLRAALEVQSSEEVTPIALAQQIGRDFDDVPAFA